MFKDRSGATAIEYALIAALISVAAIVTFQLVGANLDLVWERINATLESVL